MPYLVECLKMLKKREDVIWMTGSQIADWYVGRAGAGEPVKRRR